ncbi:rubrerythrin [Bacillus oleivorans]|uniref:Rubrerythrin n=1 Tax=Bacillus oleivorans TaxID=1448271 RepID=A0A285CLQ8_9BACI|nr:ferritin-like domain-containing protein [Bacillus oleivorans]SNX68481.1 rubrerythrin [Bacillus oleivorans]
MYTDSYLYYYRPTDRLVSDVERAINGEYSAIQCYKNIAEMADTKEAKNQIKEIRKDERKHFQQFSQIYLTLTGRQPQPKVSEKCPNTYREALEFAMKDEQETVDFYLDIADQTNNQQIKDIFRRAAADEQNHAVWFLYYLSMTR